MGLRYYPDDRPGIARHPRGRGFSYVAPDGTRIDDPAERARLAAMAVPPAYSDVWMSPLPDGHLLATGRDARGRKQHRYHPDWRAQRDAEKFAQLPVIYEHLAPLRRWIADRLRGACGTEDTAVAAVLALLDRASLRPGNAAYTRQNRTFGATTLRPRHVEFDGGQIRLTYRAKGGQDVCKTLQGARLQRVLERCRTLPGPTLLSWIDADGAAQAVSAQMVNARLREICGDGITAKSLRTWNGTRAAFMVALSADRLTVTDMAQAAANWLHNTPAVARRSYIHPKVIALAKAPDAARARACATLDPAADGLYRAGERALGRFLGAA